MTLIKSDEFRMIGNVESTARVIIKNLKPFVIPWQFWFR